MPVTVSRFEVLACASIAVWQIRYAAVQGPAPGDSCFFVLKSYLKWFDDPHLFIAQRAGPDTAEARLRAARLERTSWDERRAAAYFASHGRSLDPIEGIWYDEPLRIAVIRDSVRRVDFVGIVLQRYQQLADGRCTCPLQATSRRHIRGHHQLPELRCPAPGRSDSQAGAPEALAGNLGQGVSARARRQRIARPVRRPSANPTGA